jgi:hypothetical protein
MQVMGYDTAGKLIQRHHLPELQNAQFYTLVRFDLDKDGHPEWLGLGDESRLYVWNEQGQELWSGARKLGGTNNAIELSRPDPEEITPRVPINATPRITDIDGDGSSEVLVINNIPLVKHVIQFKVYHKSTVVAHRVEGTSLVPAWETGELDYCLTGIEADGRSLFLAAHKAKIATWGKESGLVMWFE